MRDLIYFIEVSSGIWLNTWHCKYYDMCLPRNRKYCKQWFHFRLLTLSAFGALTSLNRGASLRLCQMCMAIVLLDRSVRLKVCIEHWYWFKGTWQRRIFLGPLKVDWRETADITLVPRLDQWPSSANNVSQMCANYASGVRILTALLWKAAQVAHHIHTICNQNWLHPATVPKHIKRSNNSVQRGTWQNVEVATRGSKGSLQRSGTSGDTSYDCLLYKKVGRGLIGNIVWGKGV